MSLKSTAVVFIILSIFSASLYFYLDAELQNTSSIAKEDSDSVKEKYADFLINHPFRKAMKLSKKERIANGLPPNKFFEQEYLYTSDPVLLRPATERLYELRKELKNNGALRTPPGDPTNVWVERGPDNVGGRTHALMFAPGSITKVFAGSVSGGLWVNNNITSAASVWQQVSGVPGNLAVMSITVDPNNNNIMYLGTGEVYTGGDVMGNGIYKSTDGGNNWIELYTGSGTGITNRLAFVQDIIAWNNPTTNQTEVYFGAGSYIYGQEVVPGDDGWDWHGLNTIGLYKSTDGTNFTKLNGGIYNSSSGPYCPNDFDVAADGTLWMGTRGNAYGGGGGFVFKNTGTGWQNVRDLGTGGRVELACSQQNGQKIYVLAQDRVGATPVKIFRTTDAFSSAPTSLAQPNDADSGISANDFTRGQSFYDLMIGVDPNSDNTFYVGGIDIFKSTNSGSSWSQLSHWYGGFGYQEVHADQHGIAFAPGSSSRVIFGNDGGVFYSNNGGTDTYSRNKGYNVTQFYKAAINQSTTSENLLAGAQDNGTQLIMNAGAGINSSNEVTGGDGCWAFIDQDNQYMISSYVYNNYRYIRNTGQYRRNISASDDTGDFVNQCGLDSETNIMLSNATSGSTYRIYRWSISTTSEDATKTTLTNAMLNTIPTYFTASPYVSNRWLVGTALGKIIRLSNVNGTPTWTDISMPGQIGAVSDIRYGASENDIMVTFHNYGVTSIWYSSNGGTSWVSKEGNLPDLPVKSILQNPNNTDEVIIGTELGVWKTSDWSATNPTWQQSQNGMSDVKVMSFDFDKTDGTILVATYGRGMFTGKFVEGGCPTTTYASGSWSNGVPSSTKKAVINGNYNTSVNGNINACELIINAGRTLTVPGGTYVNVESNIVVNGTLFLDHEASLVQVNDNATVTKNGSITVRKNTPLLGAGDFMVLGSPMSAETRTGVYNSAIQMRRHITSNFVPNPQVAAQDPLAENFADDNGNDWVRENGNIIVGQGYLVLPQPDITTGGNYTLNYTAGTLNNGVINYNVEYNGNQNASPNVIGNPYASAINADLFMDANSMVNAVYFWEHITSSSNSYPGYRTDNYDMGDISMYNSSGGVAAANDATTQPIGFIASGQGFGFKATAAGTATFNNAMRVTGNNNTYRKGSIERERIWLEVSNATYGLKSSMLVSFSDASVDGYDAKYDAKRMATPVSLYSILENGEQLAIQGRSAFNQEQQVTLGFVSQVEENQEFTISINKQDGTVWDTTTVYLLDKKTGVVHDLSASDYVFSTSEGVQNDRFSLTFKSRLLGTGENKLGSISMVPNPTSGILNILSPKQTINSVEVYDIRGRKLKQVNFTNNQYRLDLSDLNTATYFVKINTDFGTFSKRIIKK